VSYAYLYPKGPQQVQRVSRWPGQEDQKNESKIPSLIWYDSSKKPAFFGEEARSPEVEDEAREKQWQLAKYFKLHLHPAELRVNHDLKVEPLPSGTTIERVYADFIGYLFRHTESFFEEFTLDGKTIWDNLAASIEFVFAHPNAWGLKEQTVLQNAAVRAGLVPSATTAGQRIHFVTEAEASVHFVWLNADLGNNLTVRFSLLLAALSLTIYRSPALSLPCVTPEALRSIQPFTKSWQLSLG
jgi:predicted small integral membrane protein